MKFVNKNVFDQSRHVIDPIICLKERKKNTPPIILDIRPQDEYKVGHLIGAYSLPAEFLQSNLSQIPPYAQIVLYGDEKDDSTVEQVELLVNNKFSDVSFVKGGYAELAEALKNAKDEMILANIPKEEWPTIIEKVLNDKVRPTLAADGGGLSVIKIEEDNVYINYEGACSGCASAATGTLSFIKNALSISLNHDINVISS